VGTKKKARDLYNDVVQVAREAGALSYGSSPKDEGFFHLSTNMVAAHRMQVIECIHDRLLKGERCIVISTQLIEAGVDVDFPEVYRELAGIDSLLQVAGRCNREGKLRDNDGNLCAGTVHVFEYEEDLDSQESGLVRTWLGSMKSIARNLIEENGGLVSEDLVKPFFISRYRGGSDELALDRGGILKSISGILQNRCRTLEYERYASEYHIIEDETDAVYIPWNDEARHLIDFARRLSTTGESAAIFMPLQHSAVGVYPHIIKQLLACGAIEVVGNYYVLLQESCITRYSEETGLPPVEESAPNSLII
jgi:CRISPR-associated endonuclease/helicase Cas3